MFGAFPCLPLNRKVGHLLGRSSSPFYIRQQVQAQGPLLEPQGERTTPACTQKIIMCVASWVKPICFFGQVDGISQAKDFVASDSHIYTSDINQKAITLGLSKANSSKANQRNAK